MLPRNININTINTREYPFGRKSAERSGMRFFRSTALMHIAVQGGTTAVVA